MLPLLLLFATPTYVEPVAEAGKVAYSPDLTQVFIDACIDGTFRKDPTYIEELGPDQLPRLHRDDAKGASEAKHYRIRGDRSGFLLTAKYQEPKNHVVSLCMLEPTGQVWLEDAVKRVNQRLFGRPVKYEKNMLSYTAVVSENHARVRLSPWQMYVEVLDAAGAVALQKEPLVSWQAK